MSFKIELGVRVEDKVSRFAGIVTERMDQLHAGNRYGVTGDVLADGKIAPSDWFDEDALAPASEP